MITLEAIIFWGWFFVSVLLLAFAFYTAVRNGLVPGLTIAASALIQLTLAVFLVEPLTLRWSLSRDAVALHDQVDALRLKAAHDIRALESELERQKSARAQRERAATELQEQLSQTTKANQAYRITIHGQKGQIASLHRTIIDREIVLSDVRAENERLSRRALNLEASTNAAIARSEWATHIARRLKGQAHRLSVAVLSSNSRQRITRVALNQVHQENTALRNGLLERDSEVARLAVALQMSIGDPAELVDRSRPTSVQPKPCSSVDLSLPKAGGFNATQAPASDLIGGKRGRYVFLEPVGISTNGARTKGFTFRPWAFTFPEWTAKEFSAAVVSLIYHLREITGSPTCFELYVRGKADAAAAISKRAIPAHLLSYGRYEVHDLKEGSYSNDRRWVSLDSYGNSDLPDLRASYIANLIANAVRDVRVAILAGAPLTDINQSARTVEIIVFLPH